jgi:mRNA interferase MazF
MVIETGVRRGDVYLIALDPARGDEIRKTRPCVVLSPDELNEHLRTFIAAPMTTGSHGYPFRGPCRFKGRSGHVVLDQIRTVDRDRMVQRLGRLSPKTLAHALGVLQEMFSQ